MKPKWLERYPLFRKLFGTKPPPAYLDPERSVFRAFSDADFIEEHESWQDLEHILHGNGGAFGIAGARGSGKTWLISKSMHWAEKYHGVGLWFPTPSDYGAEAFLRALADNFASSVMRRFPYNVPRWFSWISSPWLLGVFLLVMLILIFFGIIPSSYYIRYVLTSYSEPIREYFQCFRFTSNPSSCTANTQNLFALDPSLYPGLQIWLI
jgi:hypothetical protein